MNQLLLLATAGLQAAKTGEALSHPEYQVYVGITYAVVVVTLIGYGLWLRRKLARETAAWKASGWSEDQATASAANNSQKGGRP